MIGNYWSVGIILRSSYYDGSTDETKWCAIVDFRDAGFCQDEATEGKVYSRYFVDIKTAIDTIIIDAEKLGIRFNDKILYGEHDGESTEWPMPENWKEILAEQAKRIGWKSLYAELEQAQAIGEEHDAYIK